MVSKITVRAPSSTANLGPGFDTFGLAIDAFYDEVTLTKTKKGITIVTDDDLKLSQVDDILISHFVRRNLDPLVLGKKDKEKAGGDRIRQTITLVEGIEQDVAKKITLEIKSSKMKIQAKINGNELRIDGKKRDDLQSAMQLIEDLKIGIPVQFINFRD